MLRYVGNLGLALAMLWMQAEPVRSEDAPRVIATFSILGDWASQIGGDDIVLTILVQDDSDPHEFDPGPRQQAEIAGADLVIANGLGLEPWLGRVLEAAGFRGRLLIASSGIEPIRRDWDAQDSETGFDPHAFQDPALAEIYIGNIRDALQQLDPAHVADYGRRTASYIATLKQVADQLRTDFSTLRPERRKALTSHDAFAYFGRAFGIEFVPILAGGQSKDASASDLAAVIEEARKGGFAAIFPENMVDPRLAQAVAADSRIRIGGVLYADALSPPDGPAADYLALLRHNGKLLSEALR
jgi:zinc/manganese transport system substrate-binding protein